VCTNHPEHCPKKESYDRGDGYFRVCLAKDEEGLTRPLRCEAPERRPQRPFQARRLDTLVRSRLPGQHLWDPLEAAGFDLCPCGNGPNLL